MRLSWWEEARDVLTIFLVDLIRYFQKYLAVVQEWIKRKYVVWCLTITDVLTQSQNMLETNHKTQTTNKKHFKSRLWVDTIEKQTSCLGWNTKVQRLFSPLWAETIPTVLHPEVYRGYFAGCCAKRTVSPEQQQLHLGGVMLWYSVYSSLTSFYSEEILWRWLILELEQVHSNLLLLLGEPRGPCREESSNVAHSTVKHKQPEKEHLIEREENCELWVQPYHLDAEFFFSFSGGKRSCHFI